MLEAGELTVVDPNLEEEAAASGLMTVIVNAFGELCAVQKTSGIGLPTSEVSCKSSNSSSNSLQDPINTPKVAHPSSLCYSPCFHLQKGQSNIKSSALAADAPSFPVYCFE